MESAASKAIQKIFRGFAARWKVDAKRGGLTPEEAQEEREIIRRQRSRGLGTLGLSDGLKRAEKLAREAQAIEAARVEIQALALKLQMPPIGGYTLNVPGSTARVWRRRRAEVEQAAATLITKVVRGFLGRKKALRVKRSEQLKRAEAVSGTWVRVLKW